MNSLEDAGMWSKEKRCGGMSGKSSLRRPRLCWRSEMDEDAGMCHKELWCGEMSG